MSANEDLMAGRVRYFAPEMGVVTDVVDEKGLYRIRAEVPGIIAKTAWAWPIGTMGGGSPQRGAMTMPVVGSDVVIFFVGGDVERPLWMAAHWGEPKAGSEMPTEAKAVPPQERHLISTIHESSRVKVWVDEREGKEQLVIQDKLVEEVMVQVNLANGAIVLSSLSALTLKTLGQLRIEALQIQLNEHLVMPGDKPIG